MSHFCSQAAFPYKRTQEVQESPAWTLQGQKGGERNLWDCKGAGNQRWKKSQ